MSAPLRDFSERVFGSGRPRLTLVVGVHGDELAPLRGATRVLERLNADELTYAVRLIVANPLACARGQRYVDCDLNRAFPGASGSRRHEERLAHQLCEQVEPSIYTVDLHSTSFPVPTYGLVHSSGPGDAAEPTLRPVADYVTVDMASLISQFPHAQAFEVGHETDPATEDRAGELVTDILALAGCLGATFPRRARTVRIHTITALLLRRELASVATLADFKTVRTGELLGIGTDGVQRRASAACVAIWVNHPTAIRLAGKTATLRAPCGLAP